jgi:hypothetical protein
VHTDPLRPIIKANPTNGRQWRPYCLALIVLCMLAVPARTHAQCTATPQFNLSLYYGGQPVTINTLATNNTTAHNCAWADAVTQANSQTSFLACSLNTTGPIALCYYAGVPGAPKSTPSCTLSQGGNAAQCYCYEITANTNGAGKYSYVEITAILNLAVYNAAVAQCGSDGSLCLNAQDVQNGNLNKPEASICASLKTGPSSMFPGADLISDFSPIGEKNNLGIPPPLNPGYSCPLLGSGNVYAGCMTAPCKLTNKTDPLTKLPLAQCTCPTFNGANQVGNPQINTTTPAKSCSPAPYVWSSAYIGP